jgi:hypothetical protein
MRLLILLERDYYELALKRSMQLEAKIGSDKTLIALSLRKEDPGYTIDIKFEI